MDENQLVSLHTQQSHLRVQAWQLLPSALQVKLVEGGLNYRTKGTSEPATTGGASEGGHTMSKAWITLFDKTVTSVKAILPIASH